MNLSPYPKYKPSGVEWLGDVPVHWAITSLRWLSRRYAGGTPDKGNEAYWFEGHIPWLNSGSVNAFYITEPSSYITTEGFANSSAKWIPKDALVIALAGQGKTKGMTARLGIKATCNQSMAAIIPDRRLSADYLLWWLTANYQNIRNLAGGEARDGLNLEIIGAIPCLIPEEYEQRAIADFLDHETEKIDTLVEKKRALIERLKEERTALITHTVTRGLPPEAARAAGLEPHPKLKSSGVEWLGDMPEHWSSKRLKTISRIRYGLGQPPRELSGGVPLIRATNVIRGRITEKDMVYIDPEDVPKGRDAFLAEKEIIVVRSGAYTADSAIIPRAYDGAVTGYDMVVTVNDALAEFVSLALLCTYVRDGQLITSSMRAAQPHLNAEELGATVLLLPPLSEQRAIADFLDGETEKIDTLVEKIGGAIERLQEYRSALITAAVTGKIDVREEAVL